MASRSYRLLVCSASLCLLVIGAGCGGSGDDAEAKPGAARIVRAVLSSLLSNSVEARKSDEAGLEEPPRGDASRAEAQDARDPRLAAGNDEGLGPERCVVPYNGPVTIIRASTPTAFARSVGGRRHVPLVYETEDTAIWQDGRVLTTDVENLGSHLNAVGWASNPMQIAGASARPGSSGQNLGWDSGTSSFKDSSQTKKRKKRRRRG